MQYKDYYQIMGVERDVDAATLKRAYRVLARKYHPDVSKESDAEARFKEVGEAYEVLKDPEKRAAYDQLGADWQQGQSFKPPPDWGSGFEFSEAGFDGGFSQQGYGTHSDFFETLFGHAFRSAGDTTGDRRETHYQQPASNDHHAKILIDLEDSLNGATRAITLQVPEIDRHGHLINRQRTLNVKIPKGIKQGQHIRLAGQAESSVAGAPAGDLYLEVAIKPHRFYRVDGADLYYDLPVTPWEAALGKTIAVPTPSGSVNLKIPAGSKAGQQLALRGRGIPGKLKGDLFVVLTIALPTADNEKAKSLYRQMEETMAFNPRQHLGV